MPQAAPSKFPIYLVGLGLHAGHLTREAEECLRRCRRIYFLHPSSGVQNWLRSLDVETIDVSPLYEEGAIRMATYRSIAAVVLEAAQLGGSVALAVYGHPLVLSTLSSMVLTGAKWLGLRATVLPGISSLDTIFADLTLDPGDVALQLQEATDLLLRRRALDPRRGVLVLQPAQTSSTVYADACRATPFEVLVAYLLNFYPADHVAYLVRSSSEAGEPSDVRTAPLGTLVDAAAELLTDLTIYLPPIAESDTGEGGAGGSSRHDGYPLTA